MEQILEQAPILVTGANGFLGTHLTLLMKKRGVFHLTLDKENADYTLNLRHSHALQGRYFPKFHRVIHLAGVLGTHELFDLVYEAIDVNIKGTVNVLNLCKQQGIPFTGVTMAHVWKNPYETTKLAAERLADAWGREYEFPVNYYTIYNAFGEYQSHGAGHPQKIIPTFATHAWQQKPIPVWGDGSQIVDLVYAGDIAQLLLDDPQDGTEGGYGVGLTVKGVAEMVWSIANPGTTVQIEYLPMRRGEHTPERDPVAQAKSIQMVGFEQKLEDTVRWYR